MNKTFLIPKTAALASLLVAGCVSIPDDLGRSEVNKTIADRGFPIATEPAWSKERVATLLAEPLTVASAVEVALLNNASLQGSYAQLGFGAAEVYAGSRISNPIIGLGRLDSNAPGARDRMTAGIMASIADLITLGARREIAALDNAAVQQHVAADVANVAADTAKAFFHYVAAMQAQRLKNQTSEAARISVDLAQRFFDAGNVDEIEIAAQRALSAEASIAALNAEVDAVNARAELADLLGVATTDDWLVDGALGVPAELSTTLQEFGAKALELRLDLAAANAQVDATAKRAGLENWRGWVGDLGLSYERERESDGEKLRGFGAEIPVPVFDRGRAEFLRADADLRTAVAEVLQLEVTIRNDVQQAYAALNNALERVNIVRESLIPARRAYVTGVQQRVNFMLLGVFELIDSKRDEYEAYETYLEAVRDYWIARTDLATAVGVALPEAELAAATPVDVDALIGGEQKASGNHSNHRGGE